MTGITKEFTEKLEVVTAEAGGITRYYITAHPTTDGNYSSMFENVRDVILENGATVISQFVFGGTDFQGEGVPEIEKISPEDEWPVTWIQGDGCSGDKLTGTQVFAISGVDVKRVKHNGRVVGSTFEDDDANYCVLADLRCPDTALSRDEQTEYTFNMMEDILKSVGMTFLDTARTWLYLDDLLAWYDPFNVVRTDFFNRLKVFDHIVPSSAGIGAKNPAGAAMVADLFAITPKSDKLKVQALPSPLQCAAIDYKSSFSRAHEIETSTYRQIMISGSASIEPGGLSVNIDDTAKQIKLTMEVVAGILESRNMSWDDISRSIAYFKDINDLPLFADYCARHDIPELTVAVAHADVCRDDLLFEIELDAFQVIDQS